MPKWSKSWERFYRRVLPAYWVFLFCSTHLPQAQLPKEVPQADKLVHFVAFGLLGFLFWRCAESIERNLSARFVWIAFLTLGMYAALDEYLQQFVNRTTSLTDWLADLAGIALALIVLEVLRRRAASARREAKDEASPE